MDYLEWKNRFRYIRIATDKNAEKPMLIDDTIKVSGLIDAVGQQFGYGIAVDEDTLFANGDDDVEVLSNDMTLREQGYHGDCFLGLFTKVRGSQKRSDIGLYIKLPYYEGYLSRKGGGLGAWKKRWYILRKNKLLNYKSEKATKKELGHIPMKSCKEIKKTPASLGDIPKKQQHCCFEIVTTSRSYKMLAKNSEDKENWMRELEFSRRMFGDEADLEEMLNAQRKKIEDEQDQKKKSEEQTKKEKEEREKAERLRREKEEQARRLAEQKRQAELEAKRKQQEELERRRREEEELYLLLTQQASEMEREFGEIEEEMRELEARKAREQDEEMFRLLAEQERELEEQLRKMERDLAQLETHKLDVADRIKHQEEERLVIISEEERLASPRPSADSRSAPVPDLSLDVDATEADFEAALREAEEEMLKEQEEDARRKREEADRIREEERRKVQEDEIKRKEEKRLREEERLRRVEEQRLKEEEKRRRQEEERRKEEQRLREEEERQQKEEEERLKKEAEEMLAQLESEARQQELQAMMMQEQLRLEEERKRKEEERQRAEEQRVREEEERLRREEEERKRKEEERKKREEDALRKLEEERKRLEEERRKREEEQEARRVEEEKRRLEEEERLQREEEQRRLEEEERLRREEEEEERLRLEQEVLEKQRQELARQRQEQERLEDERRENERLENEKLEKERLIQEEHERKEREREKEQLLQKEALERETQPQQPESEPESGIVAQTEPEPEPEPTPEPEPEPELQPETEPEAAAQTEPETEPETAPEAEPEEQKEDEEEPEPKDEEPEEDEEDRDLPEIPDLDDLKDVPISREASGPITSAEKVILSQLLLSLYESFTSPTDSEELRPLLSKLIESSHSSEVSPQEQFWPTIKTSLLSTIDSKHHQELSIILDSGNIRDQAIELYDSEQVLLKWINYHLRSSTFKLTSFDDVNLDLLATLLSQLDPDLIEPSTLTQLSDQEKAETLSEVLSGVGINCHARGLLESNQRVALSLFASLFRIMPALGDLYTEVLSFRSVATRFISSSIQGLPSQQANMLPTLVADAAILSDLINQSFGTVIDKRLVVARDKNGPPLPPTSKENNWNIVLNAALTLAEYKCPFRSSDLAWISVSSSGAKGATGPQSQSVTEVLDPVVWDIVELCLLAEIRPQRIPQLYHLQQQGEEEFFVSLPPQKILRRWVNYHLRRSTYQSARSRLISNFTDDFEDASNYLYLLHAIAPELLDAAALQEALGLEDWEERTRRVFSIAQQLGCPTLLESRDVLEAENDRLTCVFLAQLCKVRHALPDYAVPAPRVAEATTTQSGASNPFGSQTSREIAQSPSGPKRDLNQEDEESSLLVWLNSLNLDCGELTSLESGFADGSVLLKLYAKFKPDAVDQKKLAQKPTTKFAQMALINYAMDVAHNKFKFQNLMIAPEDLIMGKKGPAAALVNQVKKAFGTTVVEKDKDKKRHNPRRSVSSAKQLFVQSRIKATSDEDVIEWINKKMKVARNNPKFELASLEDPRVDLVLFFDLITACSPNALKPSLIISPENNEEDRYNNCVLLMTVVWKMGLALPLHPQLFIKPQIQAVRTLSSTLLVHFNVMASMGTMMT
eukprot:TRINITY_DN12572_c0_g1_i1.p1 TRINITY_DN12572_c0_g1~~TRINITY_DN12572_c0_g1_i1.p1  ORF type:complete len:1716 (-),score=557.02 TRINITY_DN12572_c0_g1_i1:63-4877(-)